MTPPKTPRPAAARAQTGAVLLFALVALAVLLVGGVALLRAMDSSLLQAGNLGFKRDLVNQAERGAAQAITLFTSGALASETSRESHLLTQNYSATRLASDSHGIPTLLLDDAAYSAAGMQAADLSDSSTGVTLRYVIDRQCASTGDFVATSCMTASNGADTAADDRYRKVNAQNRPVYRISVRASGPRNTQAFFQTTVAR
ncbi:MAG: hypothetical protein RLY71_1151 [Pseudomonadota bacterium]|jgi:hypothetical protein